jgi:hypothetical protein
MFFHTSESKGGGFNELEPWTNTRIIVVISWSTRESRSCLKCSCNCQYKRQETSILGPVYVSFLCQSEDANSVDLLFGSLQYLISSHPITYFNNFKSTNYVFFCVWFIYLFVSLFFRRYFLYMPSRALIFSFRCRSISCGFLYMLTQFWSMGYTQLSYYLVGQWYSTWDTRRHLWGYVK